jgi:hypothetical protein
VEFNPIYEKLFYLARSRDQPTEELLLAQGHQKSGKPPQKPGRRLVDILVPGKQNEVWTDIPGRMFYRENDYVLPNFIPGKENKQNLLRTIPSHPGNLMDDGLHLQIGPRPFGTIST